MDASSLEYSVLARFLSDSVKCAQASATAAIALGNGTMMRPSHGCFAIWSKSLKRATACWNTASAALVSDTDCNPNERHWWRSTECKTRS